MPVSCERSLSQVVIKSSFLSNEVSSCQVKSSHYSTIPEGCENVIKMSFECRFGFLSLVCWQDFLVFQVEFSVG